jgi:hypothetical protein
MKKILFLFVALIAVFTVSSCEEVVEDAAKVLLQDAKDSLNGVIGDPTNITATFQVPVNLMNDVTAVWSSNNPGVITFAAPVSGLATATVNRPAFGEPDAVVTLTAVLMIESAANATEFLSDEFVIQVTVKANTVEEIVIETVADMLAIRDLAYDRTVEVVISDLTVIGIGNDGAFAYDGTGTTQLYGANFAALQVGKVYTVTGTPDWYFGLWELVNWTAVEQVGATPQYPTQQVEADVSAFIAELIADDANTFAPLNAEAGSFEPISAKVTGIVYLIPGDTGNYNTYILDTDFVVGTDTFTLGASGQPAAGLLVYYNTQDFQALRAYNGETVTIDVIVHTYRSNNNAFALYYVGGPDGIVANLSDAKKLEIDAANVTLPLSSVEATTLDLPTTGTNGASIVWSFTNVDSANNTYVNLVTGVATPPTGSQVTVGITATITVGTLDPVVKNFEFKLGLYPISTVTEAKAFVSGATARVVGVITATTDDVANGAYWLQDASGAISLFDPTNVLSPDLIGKTFEIIAPLSPFNGLIQLRINALTALTEITGSAALTIPAPVDISTLTMNVETLLPLQSQRVNLTGFVLKTALNATYTSSFNMNFINQSGQEIPVRLDRDVPGFADFVALVASSPAGTAFNFEGVLVGWFNNPQLLVASTSKITAGTAYTDQERLNTALAAYKFSVAADAEITSNVSLGTPLFGATVTLTTSNAAVIAVDGTVTRPANGAGNATVTLGYTLTLNAVSTTEVTVSVVVLEEAPSGTNTASDLFISEYIEGKPGNRKAIEIYNGTGVDVVLDGVYTLKINANANQTWSNAIVLTGTILAGDVYVVYYDDSVANDQLGTFGDLESTALSFNGDDAIGLFKNDVLIDIFGVFGEDPGSGWTLNEVANATVDSIITRAPGTTNPNTTWTLTEWIRVGAYVDGSVTTLGSHTN